MNESAAAFIARAARHEAREIDTLRAELDRAKRAHSRRVAELNNLKHKIRTARREVGDLVAYIARPAEHRHIGALRLSLGRLSELLSW